MKPTEAAALARYMRAHFPQQPIDEYTADALGETLAPYPPADCRQAVLNIAERGDDWCAPTAIKAEVKRIREKRIADYGPIEPPAGIDPDNSAQWQRWLAGALKDIADGTMTAPDVAALDYERRDVVKELGHIGQSVDEGLKAAPLRAELDRVRREQQEADAERKRAEDARWAELERMRLEDLAARAQHTDHPPAQQDDIEQVPATQEEA